MPAESVNMSVNIAGVTFKNPVTVASGTFGSGMEYSEYVDLEQTWRCDNKRCCKCAMAWQSNSHE